jgi:RNA polymerase sigma-70 factor (ECF subfamily)
MVSEEATALEKHLAECAKCREKAEDLRHDSHLTRLSLLERVRQSPCDQTAWARFVYLYTPLLRACVRKQSFSGQDLDDIVQDSLIRLFKALPGFVHEHRFRNWLTKNVRNCCRDQRKKRPMSSLHDWVEPVVPDTVEDFFKRESLRYLVRRALQLIKQDFERTTWMAYWLTAVKERPNRDVASLLGMTDGAVYTAKSRVLARLRQELDGFLDE